MRVGEVATRAGVNVETLRYYERRGLLPEPARSAGGHREYDADAVRFVRAVKEAQSLGFSLAEIEEYLSLTRRDPGAAPAAARERLAGKLEAVDAKMAALRTMRAGLVRARYELWDSVAHSTSNAAYLARGGRDPDLEGVPLHVTNGESVASTLRTTSLEGVVLSWDDVLHVGPLAFDPAESRPLRARFLAEHGWGDESASLAELERRDALLARARAVVLWFEHDLFDQLQLLQVLAQLDDEAEVEVVQADGYLGAYNAGRLEALWDARRPVEAPARALARDAWRAVCDNDLDSALARDLSVFPHLEAALRRLEEERAPLPRTKRQLLEALAEGPKTPLELFMANQAREEAMFLGDTWCFLFIWELARDGLVRPAAPVALSLPLPPPRGEHDAFVATTVELTPAGRELV
jgi:DNA-binding transcriptional MerR regulator